MTSKSYRVEGVWKGKSAGGCVNHPTWRFNPQIFLTVPEEKSVTISLTQTGLYSDFPETDHHPDIPLPHIGLYLLKSDPAAGGRRHLSCTPSELVGKCRFEDSRAVNLTVNLEPGTLYVAIPCTFKPQQESAFVAVFTSIGEMNVVPLPASKEWKLATGRSEWSGASAGGCRNFPSFHSNPQFLLKVRKTAQATILLSQSLHAKFEPLGFYVVTGTDTQNKLKIIPSSAILCKTEFRRGTEAMLTFEFKPRQHYVIIPCTFNPGHEARFTIEVFSESDVKISALKDSQELIIEGEWFGQTAGGCINFTTWRYNPQYFVFASQTINLTISLTQKPMENMPSRGFQSIGIYLVRSNGQRLIVMKKSDVVGKTAFEKKGTVSLRIDLEKSENPFVIIPATFHPERISKFSLSVFVNDDVPPESILKIFPCNYFWNKKTIEGAWVQNLSGGCRNYASWLQNPQVHLNFHRDGFVTIILSQLSLDKPVGFYIVRVLDQVPSETSTASLTPHLEPITTASRSSYVSKSSFINEPEVFLELQLTEGSYIVVICTFEPRQFGRFSLSVYSETPMFELQPLGFLPSPTPYDMKLGLHSISTANADPNSALSTASTPSSMMGSSTTASSSTISIGDLSTQPSSSSSSSSSYSSTSSSLAPPRDLRSLPGLNLIKIDEVTIQSKIGQGGFGMVYRGTYKTQAVAIKKLFREEMEASDVDTFEGEVELMTQLNHPNIVKFIGASLDPPEIFLVTEFMDRGNLTQVLRNEPSLAFKIKLNIALDASEGVAYLHSRDPPVVHRDLKSLNLLVSSDFTCKVADFGLSKASSGASLNSKVGSLNWCAPEVLLHAAPYTPSGDSYSFGMILWELLTHTPPFAKMHPLQIVRAIDRGDLPTIPPVAPEKYSTLIRACWAKEPKRRPDFPTIVKVLQLIKSENELTQ